MGLFNFLGLNKPAASRQNLISIDESLGNVLISGNSSTGKSKIFQNYAISVINQGGACVILRDAGIGFSAVPAITAQRQMVYDIDTGDGAFTEQFDPFANLNEAQTAELLFTIFNKYTEFEGNFKMKFKQYLSKMVYFIRLSGKTVKLNELSSYTIEKLEDINARARIPDTQRYQNERFFDSIRQDISILESYFYDFANNNVGFILSGDRSLEQICGTGKILEISLDFSSRKEESELLLSVLTDRLYKFDYSKCRVSQMAVVLDEVPNETLLKSGFDKLLMASSQTHTIYSVMDIAMLAEKSNVYLDKADSIFFFQQQSNKNQEYCSEFFGTYEKTKVSNTESYGRTSGTSRSSFWDYMSGNGSSSRNSGTTRGSSTTTTTEKERVYLPDVFKNLPDNQCIYFFRHDHSHNYLNI